MFHLCHQSRRPWRRSFLEFPEVDCFESGCCGKSSVLPCHFILCGAVCCRGTSYEPSSFQQEAWLCLHLPQHCGPERRLCYKFSCRRDRGHTPYWYGTLHPVMSS
eukprot:Blabericola_migrator_1__10598@NODE_6020_length_620_cov_239_748644_g4007_i0_p2_GENE_NODE_6020_length_620_cov_239_748644_g4007_i0NODE_6020_length_620_cov_239_748644_g4007_i0_p2_ORF_typecomplete_len105_score3_86Keratin_B2_2/PF13885_6/12_NODE_6020_length_620_cov_239_748644_g4007_i0250564